MLIKTAAETRGIPIFGHLPGPPASRPGIRCHDLQAEVRPPWRQSPSVQSADRQDRNHDTKPRLRLVDPATLPPDVEARATSYLNDQTLEGLRHNRLPVFRRTVPTRKRSRQARMTVLTSLRRVPQADGLSGRAARSGSTSKPPFQFGDRRRPTRRLPVLCDNYYFSIPIAECLRAGPDQETHFVPSRG